MFERHIENGLRCICLRISFNVYIHLCIVSCLFYGLFLFFILSYFIIIIFQSFGILRVFFLVGGTRVTRPMHQELREPYW